MNTIDDCLAEIRDINGKLDAMFPSFTVLVNNTEAARILGVTPKSICTYLKQHRLHRQTIQNSTGIPLAEVLGLKAQ